jgi:SAM-dependent methyltransferase
MQGASYVFDNAWQEERRRLDAVEAGWDPVSVASLQTIGVQEGWSCLEVGAGGGSIASWLCDQVGADGRVVATDLDPRFLNVINAPNLEVRRHDIVRDAVETGSYDLVHARLLLEHLPEHETALDRMIDALRPGGWLLIEDFDHTSFLPDPASDATYLSLWEGCLRAFRALSASRGLDLAYGRRLLGLLQTRGLESTRAEGHAAMQPGGSPRSEMLSLSIAKMQEGLVSTGEVDAESLRQLTTMLRDPARLWMSQLMVTAIGRKSGRD